MPTPEKEPTSNILLFPAIAAVVYGGLSFEAPSSVDRVNRVAGTVLRILCEGSAAIHGAIL